MLAGWTSAPFDEVVTDETGGNLKTLQSEFAPYGRYPIIDQGKALIAGYTDDPRRLCRTSGPVVVFGDHTCAVKFVDFPFCLGADGTKILRPRAGIDAKFLFHFLRTVDLPDAGYSRHFKYLRRIEVPVPPLAEQRRIAAILDEADALQAKRRAALAQLDELARAIFVEMFGAAPTWSTRWPCRPFEETMRDETSRSNKLQAGEFLSIGSFPVIDQGQSEIAGYCDDPAYLCVSSLPCVVFGDHTRAVKLVRKPFVIGADGAKVLVPCYGIEPVFLSYMMRFAPIPDLGYSRHMREVKRLSFPAPPSALQMEFARRIESLETHREVMSRSTVELNALFASLQHRAFRGEL